MQSEPYQIIERRAALVGGEAPGCRDLDELSFGGNAEPAIPSFEPNLVLGKLFSGLPHPELPTALARPVPHVAPGPIIEAALKAAGLIRSPSAKK